MNRNEFLKLAIGLGATIGTLGCTGDGEDDDGADTGAAGSSGNGSDDVVTTAGDTEDTTGSADTDTPGSTGVDPTTGVDGSSEDDGSTSNATMDGSSSDDGSGSTTAAAECTDDPVVEIGGNHMHALLVPIADVLAALQVDYNIQGGSRHPHTVTVTTEDFETLAATGTVMVTSTMNAMHTHTVTLSCA